jgi:hypothetical protein
MSCSKKHVRKLHEQLIITEYVGEKILPQQSINITKCLRLSPTINKLCDYHVGTRNSGENEEKDKYDLKPEPSFTKVQAAYKTIQSFLYMYSINEHDQQNILILELEDLTKQLSTPDTCVKAVLQAGIGITFYLFITFVGISEKIMIFIFRHICRIAK